MLELMKNLLGIALTDVSKDIILNFYLTKAKQSIITYKNKSYLDEEYESQFLNQTAELAIYYYKNKDTVGLSSIAQGGRSLSKGSSNIPQDIIMSLGLPYVKVGA